MNRLSCAPLPLLIMGACVPGRPTCPEGQRYDWDAASCLVDAAGPPVSADVWRPPTDTTWQWQLSGTLDTSLPVAMYDVDLADTSNADLAALAAEHVVICYFSAGSLESYRDDIADVPAEAIGRRLDGWRDERWLDVTHPAVRDLVTSRLDRAVARGCDGVEPDNVDGVANATGLPINATEQRAFNRFIADEAHARGLSVGLKNTVDHVAALEPWFDWALNEQCFQYDECAAYGPFHNANKAVFHAEYVDHWDDAPALAARMCPIAGLSSLIKTPDLGPERLACVP